MAKDYYQVLGVPRTASEKDIKRAYRKLARQHHPDINPDNKSSESRFKEINQAYQVLSDKEKRALYDQLGPDFEKIAAAGGAGPGGTPVDFGDLFNQVGRGRRGAARGGEQTYHIPTDDMEQGDVGELFESLFGTIRGQGRRTGGGMGFRGRSRGPQRGEDMEHPLEIALAESIRGTQRSLQLTVEDPATGQRQTRQVTVKIPAGVKEGARVRVAGQGTQGQNGGTAGDLFLRIHLAPHPFWRREGYDMHCEVPITFAEAALGAQIQVPTVNGEVQLKIPAGTQSGQVFRLTGRGVPHIKGTGAGDQFVKVKIAVPRNLGPREEELIQELARLRDQNVRLNLQAEL